MPSRNNRLSSVSCKARRAAVLPLMFLFSLSLPAQAQTYQVIHNFNLATGDGAGPEAGLLLDSHGNLFGTTFAGGVSSQCTTGYTCGTVFEMSPANGGGWTETVIRNLGNIDGHPGTPMTMDAHGNLYGTAAGFNTYGSVFELLAGSNGTWTEQILHQFMGGADGSDAGSGLTLDTSGVVYGTTFNGGEYNDGTVYSVNPHSILGKKLIHSFVPSVTSGNSPSSTYLQIINGHIYGTTSYGGPSGTPYGNGTVFELTPSGSGWSATTLYSFKGPLNGDGAHPVAGLLFDGTNNFYGTTQLGGTGTGNCQPYGCGTVYRLTHNADGSWTETVLHSFENGLDGNGAWGNLIFDAAGNIYGTTYAGGVLYGYGNGTVFKLKPGSGGQWTYSVLVRLPGGNGGSIIDGGLVIHSAGNLYGTAQNGGTYGDGVVFEITP
jgi:uncharacterized repeat protein (TIGR03803 family)